MSAPITASSSLSAPASGERQLTPKKIALGLGSNYQQEHYFQQALDALQKVFGELTISSVYDSPPVEKNNISSPHFTQDMSINTHYHNAIVVVESVLSVAEIKKITRDIERQCDRDRTKTKVTMDVDFLLYGDLLYNEGDIHLPHASIENNAYVLRPLADLLPVMTHPQVGETFLELWQKMVAHDGSTLMPVDFIWQDEVVSVSPPCLSL